MFKAFCRWLFKLRGWRFVGEDLTTHRRCVVVAAPHTSNWDLIFTIASFDLMGLPVRFTIKREWMRFPFNLVLGPVGGLAIDRRPRAETGERPSMVEAMAGLFDEHPGELAIAVTPEGTRSRRERWRSGFYHVAREANVPILLGYLDYGKKEAGIGKVIVPGDDFEADMREIMAFYSQIEAHSPEKFALDARFS
ncbi:acyltransferase [Lujinxingia vulgaris]|uniref:Acyltransferase n=1 Tax=Lujinxingia vulgaris TaxID=2600176 RepID=A0A5C6WYZ8_9DELT|nr:1-acyl-sn-glycerol-3-phosphate acyltransferase [Lujinxingia vulgaris]TXD31439.1 acyltransferase [Lujinxingia vulgaris]